MSARSWTARSLPSPSPNTVRSACVGLSLRRLAMVSPSGPISHCAYIEAAAVAFGHADDGGELGALRRLCEFFRPAGCHRTTSYRNSAARSRGRSPRRELQPDLPRISGNEGLRKRDQLCALRGRLIDQGDGLVHRCIKIEKNRRRLNHRNLVFLMNETHRCHPFALRDQLPWVRRLQPQRAAPLVRSGMKTCLNWRVGGARRQVRPRHLQSVKPDNRISEIIP